MQRTTLHPAQIHLLIIFVLHLFWGPRWAILIHEVNLDFGDFETLAASKANLVYQLNVDIDIRITSFTGSSKPSNKSIKNVFCLRPPRIFWSKSHLFPCDVFSFQSTIMNSTITVDNVTFCFYEELNTYTYCPSENPLYSVSAGKLMNLQLKQKLGFVNRGLKATRRLALPSPICY